MNHILEQFFEQLMIKDSMVTFNKTMLLQEM
jgi:hypothetical protein